MMASTEAAPPASAEAVAKAPPQNDEAPAAAAAAAAAASSTSSSAEVAGESGPLVDLAQASRAEGTDAANFSARSAAARAAVLSSPPAGGGGTKCPRPPGVYGKFTDPTPPTHPDVALAAWREQQKKKRPAVPHPRLPTNPNPSSVPSTAAAAAAPGGKKRGRPVGSKNSKPRKMIKPAPRTFATKADEKKFQMARTRITRSQTKLDKAEADVARLQKLLDDSKKAADRAKADVTKTYENVADALLLEPTTWNDNYNLLLRWKEREGNIDLKRVKSKVDLPFFHSLPPEKQKEYRTLSNWSGQQRTAREAGTLQRYQQILLDRIGFSWKMPQGPGPEKWLRQYERLKEFKRVHGHCRVPNTYPPDPKLANWASSQVTQYRYRQAGKKPGLSDERIRLLQELGFDWGVARVNTPWEYRFQELCRYKEEFGNPHVPWRWKRNRPLAGWVNSERKKYKNMLDGKPSPLTTEQIQKLNGIGFQWSAGRKRQYDRPERSSAKAEAEEEEAASETEGSEQERQGDEHSYGDKLV